MVLPPVAGTVKALTGTQIALNNVARACRRSTRPTQQWIYDPSTMPNDVKYLSFVTPIGGISLPRRTLARRCGPQYCGKAVFSDLHAGGSPSGDFPAAARARR